MNGIRHAVERGTAIVGVSAIAEGFEMADTSALINCGISKVHPALLVANTNIRLTSRFNRLTLTVYACSPALRSS
jgi:hypothetical protein